MKIRLLVLPLAVLMVGVFVGQIFANVAGFEDVNDSHANAEAIKYVKDEGIVEGYDDGTYQPDATINRAEFTKILMEAVYDDIGEEGDCFSDVADEWFAKYVCKAKGAGVIEGYPGGEFRPGQDISFVEAAKIIVLAFGEQTESNEVWYVPYVQSLSDKTVIPWSIDELDKKITRGEMAEMIFRLRAGIVGRGAMEFDRESDGLRRIEAKVPTEEEVIEPVEPVEVTEPTEPVVEEDDLGVIERMSGVGGNTYDVLGCGEVFVPPHAFLDGCEYRCRQGYKKVDSGECAKIDVPENGLLNDNDFVCELGFKREGDTCIEVEVPEHAFLEGYFYKCEAGFVPTEDGCVQGICSYLDVYVPEGGTRYECDFLCNPGYCRIGNDCVEIDVPFQGEAFQCDFVCRDGWCKEDGTCKEVYVPENGKVKGCDFTCNAGYCRKDNQCVRVKIPEFGFQDGCSFRCGVGYTQVGEECVKDEGL